MPSVKFLRFATRLPAYEGVLAVRLKEESEYNEDGYRPKQVQNPPKVPDYYQPPTNLIPIEYEQ